MNSPVGTGRRSPCAVSVDEQIASWARVFQGLLEGIQQLWNQLSSENQAYVVETVRRASSLQRVPQGCQERKVERAAISPKEPSLK